MISIQGLAELKVTHITENVNHVSDLVLGQAGVCQKCVNVKSHPFQPFTSSVVIQLVLFTDTHRCQTTMCRCISVL